MIDLCWAMLLCALIPFVLAFWNRSLFLSPRRIPAQVEPVSVLIPARNEEAGIAACLEAILASQYVELDVVVLDDHSSDRTAEIVAEIAAKDSRVRLLYSKPLPEGWCGKQHACWQLSRAAHYDNLAFLDADVHLQPNALAYLVGFQQDRKAPLVSAFPRQITITWMEKLIVPMIRFMLLGYLPMWGMRNWKSVGFGVGCGQFFLARRDKYEAIGGHQAVKGSMHDGLMLPRAYRRAGYKTDLCDGRELAQCRMYTGALAVWNGFAKNAREGIARMPTILVFSALLLCGHILPLMMLIFQVCWTDDQRFVLCLAIGFSLLSKILTLETYRPREMLEGLLYPMSIFLFLGIQWYANFRFWIGRPVGWRGRTVLASLEA